VPVIAIVVVALAVLAVGSVLAVVLSSTGSSTHASNLSSTTTTITYASADNSGPYVDGSNTTTSVPSTTTTTTPLTSVLQKFVGDVQVQFPGLSGAMAAGGSFSTQTLADEGQAICGAFSSDSQNIGPSGFADLVGVFESLVGTIANGGGLPGPTGAVAEVQPVPTVSPRADIVMALAITDICPTYAAGIPPGDPGAR
jgi:hypothetical protein